MKQITGFCLLALFALAPLLAEDLQVDIRFWDRAVYYAGLDNQNIDVLITITNNTAEIKRFKLAEERSFSLDFDVRSMNNRKLPENPDLLKKRISYKPLYFREISLESGESFSFKENIRDFVKLQEAGSFVLSLSLYPDLFRNENTEGFAGFSRSSDVSTLVSNRIHLVLKRRPMKDGESKEFLLPFDEKTMAVLERIPLAPDEVVAYMLNGRIDGQWEKFFLYIDLESMLLRDSKRRRSWQAESEEGRQKMLIQYKNNLMNAQVDGDISTIPIEYTIINTRYSPSEGEVKVVEKFRDGVYVSKKEYIYSLKKTDNLWLVTGYSVSNLGVE